MSARLDIDLENERVNLDGAWLSREDLTQRIQQMLASGDFKITRLSEALEQLAHAVSGVKTLTMKLSAEQFAKLESAGGRLGKPAPAFARELLMQVLGSAVAASTSSTANTPVATPVIAVTPAPNAPPIIAAPPVVAPPPVMTPAAVPPVMVPSGLAAATTSDVTPEEAAAALTITPKRRNDTQPGVPPVMVPIAPPAVTAPVGDPSEDPSKRSVGAPGEGKRWFNRT